MTSTTESSASPSAESCLSLLLDVGFAILIHSHDHPSPPMSPSPAESVLDLLHEIRDVLILEHTELACELPVVGALEPWSDSYLHGVLLGDQALGLSSGVV